MSLSQRLQEYIAAAFTGLWLQSYEHEDALGEIARLCSQNHWPMAVWDVDRGLQVQGKAAEGASDPVAAIKSIAALASNDEKGSALLVLPNFHRFIQSAEVIQALAHQVLDGRGNRTFVLILSPVVQLPPELEKLFVVIEHDLPGRDDLLQIAQAVATEEGELPRGEQMERLLEAAAGLTRFEAENSFALSLVRRGRLAPDTLWELKTQVLKKSGLLTLHRGTERFEDLGGLDSIKAFCGRALRSRAGSAARARGVMLLGVPGTGKSAFAKALGNETARPTLTMDIGSLLGSLVGQSEQNIRQALRIADAMAPAVLFIDEVEKGLAGAASSGQTDSGVSARLFGTFLTWLSDHETDVFVVATCNDISKLPPEFGRAERFDGVFFLDVPSRQQRQGIWKIYLKHFGLIDQPLPEDSDWTGAEIRSCCRLACLLDVPLLEAAQNVVPVAVTASESVERLRNWACGRCLSSCQAGVYRRSEKLPAGRRRRVAADPSAN